MQHSTTCGLRLQEMLLVIARNQDQTHLRAEHLEAGLKFVINSLDETYIDAPFASKLVRASADKETVLCPSAPTQQNVVPSMLSSKSLATRYS